MLMIKYTTIQSVKAATAALTLFSFFFITCSSRSVEKISKLRKITLKYNIPILKLTGELLNITDSVSIFYYYDDILYQFPYTYTLENENTILSQEIKYKYFVYRKGESYGYYYDSLNSKNFRKLPVDSLLGLKAFVGNKFWDKNNYSLVGVRNNEDNYTLIEKYVTKIKPDETYSDTAILYFTDKLRNIEYSFSNELENAKKLKLCKIRILYNSQFYKGYSFRFPQREFSFELKEDTVANPMMYILLFNRFNKDRSG